MNNILEALEKKGYAVENTFYTAAETKEIIERIEKAEGDNANFRGTKDLFAIRNFLTEIPQVKPILFNTRLKALTESFGEGFKVVKSIYFDKPPVSNWFVYYHQDITINIKKRIATEGYKNWVKKENYYTVQPPVEILNNSITVRIHLDDTTENNGALIVKEGTHTAGVIDKTKEPIEKYDEKACEVKAGGIMLMKPLLFHASKKNSKQ